MQLSKEVIKEYKKIYKEIEGKEISDEEAREQGTRLVNLFRVLLEVDANEKSKDKIVFLKYQEELKPLIKIRDNKKQVIIIFIPFDGEHITLHLQKDNSILKTYWNKNKPKSTWDGTTVEVARKLGYKDPERHGKYVFHEPLGTSESNVYHLVGRRIDFSQIQDDDKYYRYGDKDKLIIDVRQKVFMLELFLFTSSNSVTDKNKIDTSLGKIIFKIKNIS